MKQKFTKGLHELGGGAWAWLEPDGVGGSSNAGLVVDGDASLLVDTLFDLAHTGEMLKVMRDVAPRAATRIDTLVNTHSDGDHCWGNELVEGAEIIASVAALEDMSNAVPPAAMAAWFEEHADDQSPLARYYRYQCGPYEFGNIRYTLPKRTFSGQLSLRVGDKPVELIQVGPAHSRGDVLAWLPEEKTVFTGDILFVDVTPIVWGNTQGWIDACLRIEAMDVTTVVPGHGPVTDKRGVAALRGYLEYVRDESRLRYDAGMDVARAARDIALGEYAAWLDPERIVVNIDHLYREFSGAGERTAEEVGEIFEQAARLRGF